MNCWSWNVGGQVHVGELGDTLESTKNHVLCVNSWWWQLFYHWAILWFLLTYFWRGLWSQTPHRWVTRQRCCSYQDSSSSSASLSSCVLFSTDNQSVSTQLPHTCPDKCISGYVSKMRERKYLSSQQSIQGVVTMNRQEAKHCSYPKIWPRVLEAQFRSKFCQNGTNYLISKQEKIQHPPISKNHPARTIAQWQGGLALH